MPRTPLLGVPVAWREATGWDELVLVEGDGGLATAVAVLQGRARFPAAGRDGALTARDLPVGDVDALIVALRVDRLGDRLIAEGTCATCSAPVDVDFGLAAYCAHNRPRATRLADQDPGEPGWWRLRRAETWFRVPTAGDVLTAAEEADPHEALLATCVRGERSTRAMRAVDRALESVAPTLRTRVQGGCPECGAAVDLDVDARGLCLDELRFLAGAVLDEVHLVAAAYHWREREILDLPGARRTAYAERIRTARGAGMPTEVRGG